MSSVNANRQVLDPHYVTGLVDGEGSFCVSFSPRPKLLVRWETRPSFSVSQNYRSRGVLYKLQTFFGCGSVRESKGDRTWKYEVRSLSDLGTFIVPHFRKFPLQTAKQQDFHKFDRIVSFMIQGKHLQKEGWQEIFTFAQGMNPGGKRKYNST